MRLTPFVDFSTYNANNQFGQYDRTYYPLTGHHIGSDFKVPVGTPILAPCDGEMFKVYTKPSTGNIGIFIFTYNQQMWGLELYHLRELPSVKLRKRGDIIAYSGNTGSATTGAHLHCVMHKDATVTKNYAELVNEAAYVRLWREGRIVDPYLWFYSRM